MGGGLSRSRRIPREQLAAPLLSVAGKAPEDRKRTRFLRRYEPGDGLDPTAEHADFLVVFGHPDENPTGDRIAWSDAENLWFQAIPGFEDEKLAGVRALRDAWTAKFRVDAVVDGDTVPMKSFQALTREHVMELLRGAGIDVSTRLSRDGSRVYALCRAQTKRLEKEAARVGYALPFKPEELLAQPSDGRLWAADLPPVDDTMTVIYAFLAVVVCHALAVGRHVVRNGSGSAESLPHGLWMGAWEFRAFNVK